MERIKVPAVGPTDAKVLVVGEAPGKDEELRLTPFVGASGVELTKMLADAGLLRADCRITNVCKYRPPNNNIDFWLKAPTKTRAATHNELIAEGLNELRIEVETLKPKLILAFGNTPLWALTGEFGIGKWRGSILQTQGYMHETYVVPTYHPASILRDWSQRFVAVQDLRRARRLLNGEISRPEYDFIVQPSFEQVIDWFDWIFEKLKAGPYKLAGDIETLKQKFIDCIGFAWTPTKAICIPFVDFRRDNRAYWSIEEEVWIVKKLRELLSHPNLQLVGQNWDYDYQYLARHFGVDARRWRDTMTTHHVLFAGLPNALDFQSSLYLDWHEYWKDEGKDRHKDMDQLRHWTYNAKDCVATYGIIEEQLKVEEQLNFPSTEYGSPMEIQHSMHDIVALAMLRGVRVDKKKAGELTLEIDFEISKRQHWLNKVTNRELNPNSPKQLREFFYDELSCKKIYNRKAKSKAPTTSDDALQLIAKREPLLLPIVETINEIRQLRNARAFTSRNLDTDGRIRCSYNISGTETYRFASSTDAFGFGTNLQNVTKGHEGHGDFRIPNLRTLFIPDPGYTIGDFDLSAADAQVVAAESEDWEFLEILQDPNSNLHNENMRRWGVTRPVAKGCVHATNYGATTYSLMMNFGLKRDHVEMIQADWFAQRPKIKNWHDRIQAELMTRRYVENRFGYRRFYFGRIENLLKEALAWIPQSTVAIVTNLGIRNVVRNLRHLDVQFLLQVHDSGVFQFPTWNTRNVVPAIIEQMRIPIPYERPLTIPVGGEISEKSWGEVKPFETDN